MLLRYLFVNALAFLQRDHDEIKRLFKLLPSRPEDSRSVCDAISLAIESHSFLEESVFYPVMEEQQKPELIALVGTSLQEHQQIKSLTRDIRDLSIGDSRLGPKAMELWDALSRHLAEEENELFPLARETIGAAELARIGEELEAARNTHAAGRASRPETREL